MHSLRRDSLRLRSEALRKTLAGLAESGTPLIVEGVRDRASLLRAGVQNKAFTVNQSPQRVAERVAREADEAIVLTDFDATGEELAGRMAEALEAACVKPDLEVRRRLRGILGLRYFEEFDRKAVELEEKLRECER